MRCAKRTDAASSSRTPRPTSPARNCRNWSAPRIESNGGRITTSQNQGPKDEGRFRQIIVTVQFFASTPALQKILYALEAQPPYLLVENMTLRPLNAFRGFRPAPGQEPEINVQLDVAGFAFAEPEGK